MASNKFSIERAIPSPIGDAACHSLLPCRGTVSVPDARSRRHKVDELNENSSPCVKLSTDPITSNAIAIAAVFLYINTALAHLQSKLGVA
ncbi:MAG: hypothetical protein PUP91_00580 [Rhizonema sp. PD37]|nr:hypothetical protein [Rhizonema sp. PD37]